VQQLKLINNPGLIWLRVAVVYFVIAVGLGIEMGISGDHSLFSVHAHLNLLGWVSMALIGLIYERVPEIGHNILAVIQFWLYNLGLPVQMVTLGLKLRGMGHLDPVLGISALMVAISVLLFACNLLFADRKLFAGRNASLQPS
jgi:hypothetical protein